MIVQDLRYSSRLLVRKPGFTAVAVLTLGVGIGANITIFSVMNAVLLRPLASTEPDRVVRIAARTAAGAAVPRLSFPDFAALRERATTLADVSGANLGTFILTADNRTDQTLGEIVSGRYLSTLGAPVVAGRMLNDADDRPGAPPVAVISETFRQQRFGSDTNVVGREVLLTGRPYTIVGVIDRSFIGSFIGFPVDLWVPIATSGNALGPDWETDRSKRLLTVTGRLKPGMSAEQARAELQVVGEALTRDFAPAQRFKSIEVLPGTLSTGSQRRLARMFLSMLFGLVALVLLVACANVGNLVLARVLGRRRELAIRVALGASRARIAWMLFGESALIAGAGGVVALVGSLWTSRAFATITPLPNLSLRLDVEPDVRVIGFAVLATLAAAVVLALVGAFQAMRAETAPALKDDAAGSIGGGSSRLRGALAAVQMTVSLVLLVGAALFLRSARNAEAIELGFDPRGVLATDLDSAAESALLEGGRLFEQILERVSALPGIEAVALSTRAPLDSSTPVVRVNAREAVSPATEASSTTASLLVVTPKYFHVVKTPIVRGRGFTDQDRADRARVVMVNETLAARLWPGADAIGRRLWIDLSVSEVSDTSDSSCCQVVGVARNSKYLTLGEENQGHIYLPFAQHPRPGVALLVRSSNPTDRLANAVQATLRAIDPKVQGFFTRTLAQHVGVSTLPVRIAARVATGVALLALGLAVVGLYSLVSFLVAERTHEIGLRMALGADSGAVMRLVLGHGVSLAAAGLVIGIPAALASSRLLGSLLYGVSPTDPAIFAAVSAMLLLVSALACYLPARRAMRLDPLVALRRN